MLPLLILPKIICQVTHPPFWCPCYICSTCRLLNIEIYPVYTKKRYTSVIELQSVHRVYLLEKSSAPILSHVHIRNRN